MKTKLINITPDDISAELYTDVYLTKYWQVSFKVPANISLSDLVIYKQQKEAETIKEFIEENKITKDELLDWLNKNYK